MKTSTDPLSSYLHWNVKTISECQTLLYQLASSRRCVSSLCFMNLRTRTFCQPWRTSSDLSELHLVSLPHEGYMNNIQNRDREREKGELVGPFSVTSPSNGQVSDRHCPTITSKHEVHKVASRTFTCKQCCPSTSIFKDVPHNGRFARCADTV